MPADPTEQSPTDEQIAAQMRALFAAIPIPSALQTRNAADLRSTGEASANAPSTDTGRAGRLTTRPAPIRLLFPPTDHGRARRWPWLVAGSAAALVALLFAALFLSRPVAPLGSGAVPSCRDTASGITLTVTAAYADATRTLVRYHTNRTDEAVPHWIALIDSEGNRYRMLYGLGYHQGAQESFAEFAPLPSSLLSGTQRLILYVPDMENPLVDDNHIVATGPWAACFTVTPARGTSLQLEQTPVTAQGITITPLQLDIAPPNTQPDLVNGGARVTVRLSGLDPNTLVDNLHLFDSALTFGPQTPPYNEFSVGGEIQGQGHVSFAAAPAIAAVVPTEEWVPTTWVTGPGMSPSDDTLRAIQQTVGKSGETELQIIIFGPLKASMEKPTTMTFTRLPIATLQPDGSIQEQPLDGEWQFHIPLASA
jgi:hypothetical protein